MRKLVLRVLNIVSLLLIVLSLRSTAFAAASPDTTITPINNAEGTSDTVTVTNLAAGDIIKVYSSTTSEKPIGTATAKVLKGATTATAVVTIPQIGEKAGNIYVTITSKGLLESARVAVAYSEEKQTTIPALTEATIVNNALGTSDTVTITNLAAGDIVRVYSTLTSEKVLGSATAKILKGETTATAIINISQIGATSGTAYITVTSKGLLESDRKAVEYEAEKKTVIPELLEATIVNNAVGTPDTVTVTNISVGDMIKVYAKSTSETVLGTATAKILKGQSIATATINISQIGATSGTAYITVTTKGLLESNRKAVAYVAEKKTIIPELFEATIVNNASGTPDTVTVTNVSVGDIIKVYAKTTSETALGTATAKILKGETIATAVVSIRQLGAASGRAYITVRSKGLLESSRKSVTYSSEKRTVIPELFEATIVNNAAGTPDTVTVTNVSVGDIIKVYSKKTSETASGTATAKVLKGESAATAVVNISQIGAAAGKVYITVTSKGLLESSKKAVIYGAEQKTVIPELLEATIVNNAAGTSDIVTVKNLAAGDIIKIYSTGTSKTVIGTATAKILKGEKTATAVINISQIGETAGTAYITVTSKGLLESNRKSVEYTEEQQTTIPELFEATIVNNAEGTSDTVTVVNLSAGDIIKVYSTDTKEILLATATAKILKGQETATAVINIPQIGESAGIAYITVTSKGLLESDTKEVEYEDEGTTDPIIVI